MYKLVVAIGVAAMFCLVQGCGSTKEETASAHTTKALFIEQAIGVCVKNESEREAAISAWKKKSSGGSAEAEPNLEEGLRTIIAPSMRHKAEELGALEVPAKDEAKIDRMIENLKKGSDNLAEEGSESIPDPAISAFEGEAAAYGLEACQNP